MHVDDGVLAIDDKSLRHPGNAKLKPKLTIAIDADAAIRIAMLI